jgi:hypothetical protein
MIILAATKNPDLEYFMTEKEAHIGGNFVGSCRSGP